MSKRVHWAGGVSLPKAKMLKGWPCCCSGITAMQIKEEGNQTRDLEKVTCKKCLRSLERAGVVDE